MSVTPTTSKHHLKKWVPEMEHPKCLLVLVEPHLISDALTLLDRQGLLLIDKTKCDGQLASKISGGKVTNDRIAVAFVDIVPQSPGYDSTTGRHLDNGRLITLNKINDVLSNCSEGGAHSASVADRHIWWTATSSAALTAYSDVFPAIDERIKERVEKALSTLVSPYEVKSVFPGYRTHAIACLVETGSELYVCKIFKYGMRRYLKNELTVADMAEQCESITPVVEAGDNYMITPYYGEAQLLGSYRSRIRSMPLHLVRRALHVVKFLHKRGICPLDFNPNNVLVLKNGSIRCIDFEMLYRYKKNRLPLNCSLFYKGYEPGLSYDGPISFPQTYDRIWLPSIGLPRDIILGDSWFQQMKYRIPFISQRAVTKFEHKLRAKYNRLLP